MYECGPIIIQIIPNVTQWIMLFITCSYTFKPLDDTADKVIFIKTDPGQSEAGLFTLSTRFSRLQRKKKFEQSQYLLL